jgi:hypothetical protein
MTIEQNPETQHNPLSKKLAFISIFGRAAGIACILLAFVTCALTVTTISNAADTHGPYYVAAFIFVNLGLWLFIIGNNARKKIVAEEIRLFEEERERRRKGSSAG